MRSIHKVVPKYDGDRVNTFAGIRLAYYNVWQIHPNITPFQPPTQARAVRGAHSLGQRVQGVSAALLFTPALTVRCAPRTLVTKADARFRITGFPTCAARFASLRRWATGTGRGETTCFFFFSLPVEPTFYLPPGEAQFLGECVKSFPVWVRLRLERGAQCAELRVSEQFRHLFRGAVFVGVFDEVCAN